MNKRFKEGGIVTHSTTYIPDTFPEAIIPLDRLHELISRGDRCRQHHRALCMIITESLLTPGTVTGYYCSHPVKDSKDKFIKLLNELQIEGGAYMDVGNEIQFNNGSKIVFACNSACGNFRIIAPHPVVEWVQEVTPFDQEGYKKIAERFLKQAKDLDSDETNPL